MMRSVFLPMCAMLVLFAALLPGCRGKETPASSTAGAPTGATEEGKGMETTTATTFQLRSTGIHDGQPVPQLYTGDGKDLSPPLAWDNVPEGTVELALIVEDPDAPGGDFVHWVVYGMPPSLNGLDEGLPTVDHPDELVRFTQGRNDYGRTGYRGPAPPPGKAHHYHFRLMALDKALNLPPNATKGDLRQAVRGHIIADTELTGTYGR